MENEIVKYNNDFNNQALRSFTAEELNLLITLFHKLKEKGTNIFEYSLSKDFEVARTKVISKSL